MGRWQNMTSQIGFGVWCGVVLWCGVVVWFGLVWSGVVLPPPSSFGWGLPSSFWWWCSPLSSIGVVCWYGCGAFSWAKHWTSVKMIAEVRRDKTERIVQNCKTTNKCVLPQQLIKTHCVMTFKNSEVHFDCDVSLRRLRGWVEVSFLAPYCHIRGRGLTVLLPATSAGGPFWPASHYKRHSWGRGRSLSSSACSGVLLAAPDDRQHGEDVDMTVSVRTPARPGVPRLYWSNRTHPRFSICLWIVSRSSTFVPMSAILSPDCTLRKTTCLPRTAAWSHK